MKGLDYYLWNGEIKINLTVDSQFWHLFVEIWVSKKKKNIRQSGDNPAHQLQY